MTTEAPMTTILVGSDLTDGSRPAILRGAELVQSAGDRLIVCHAADKVLPVSPLFPHETSEKIAAVAGVEQRILDALTAQVVDVTGKTTFDVVVDFGDPSEVICAQAAHLRADLVIVSADRPGVGEVARDLSASPCSVLVVGASAGNAAAIVILESELASLVTLIEVARSVVPRPVSKFVVILQVDSPERKAPLLAELDGIRRTLGVPLEPWFTEVADPTALSRAASDPEIGLVALAAPRPDKVVEGRASPLDDGFEGATASFLLLRR
jgi:nucleotide-binding universal stress UspA family protein